MLCMHTKLIHFNFLRNNVANVTILHLQRCCISCLMILLFT